MSIYVYGVVPAGVEGPQETRVIQQGDLGALVADVPDGFTAGKREDLERHQRVLEETAARDTVLPMRFGVVVDDEDHVKRSVLGGNAEELTQLVRELEGCVQMTLKAFYAEGTLLREVLASDKEIARLNEATRDQPEELTRDARIELGRRVAAAVEERRAHDRDTILERVRPLVVDVVDEPPATERGAAQLQLLVKRDSREELDAAVAAIAEEAGDRLAVRYLGPLPPYSFTDLSLDAEEPAWA